MVDSRDIVELEVKHKKYEILIRKKEAIKWDSPPQTQPGLHVMAHTAGPQYYAPPPSPPQPAFESAAAPPPPAAAPAPAKAAPGAPPMLSPMAGTFYRSPAPGEPSFVKVCIFSLLPCPLFSSPLLSSPLLSSPLLCVVYPDQVPDGSAAAMSEEATKRNDRT